VATPYFSVVIPVYNKAPHIPRSISSVLNQTLQDYEIILINDSSTDDSVQEIVKFTDKRIKLIHRKCRGPGGYAARNRGIEESQGEWIAFLDADDAWQADHLQKMRELAQEFPESQFLGCGWNTVDNDNSQPYVDKYYEKHYSDGSHVIFLHEFLKLRLANVFPVWSSVACVKNVPSAVKLFPDDHSFRQGGDQYAWIALVIRTKSIAWSPHIGATYYRNSVNMVTKTEARDPGVWILARNRLVPLLNCEDSRILNKILNRNIWGMWRANLLDDPDHLYLLSDHLKKNNDLLYCILRTPFFYLPLPLARKVLYWKRILFR
jgi:glycosyltransferase involved in cell wall biosynthesis